MGNKAMKPFPPSKAQHKRMKLKTPDQKDKVSAEKQALVERLRKAAKGVE